jgi:predicted transcriptional regulator
MNSTEQSIRLSLLVSPELNSRLEQLAASGHTTKSDVLRKAIALFDVVSEAKSENKRLGILDRDKKLVTEIVGL